MPGYLKQVHPVLPVKDVKKAVDFYVKKLNFKLAFADSTSTMGYAGVSRDNVEIHLQWHDEKEWIEGLDRPMLRIYTDNVEALYEEYKTSGVYHARTILKETPWGTKEFAFFDLYGNGLTFYRDSN
ncbi:glyoxalase superfamily protein [Winogradskyella ursingii]|uniref:glyoxalase superfamily protein n=1 Tax=Winogradskyella ursingii TaxID=2686079 RepID=UPI0015CEB64C|nr:glyoxalase superfamily protein [Winogradskyella ursingii]